MFAGTLVALVQPEQAPAARDAAAPNRHTWSPGRSIKSLRVVPRVDLRSRYMYCTVMLPL
jgi:hypothetical protein